MTIIQMTEAEEPLHDILRAVLTDGEVLFENDGQIVTRMLWTGSRESREVVLQELSNTIGFDASSVPLPKI